jgi:hypothetical protein
MMYFSSYSISKYSIILVMLLSINYFVISLLFSDSINDKLFYNITVTLIGISFIISAIFLTIYMIFPTYSICCKHESNYENNIIVIQDNNPFEELYYQYQNDI